MRARDLMTSQVVTARADTSAKEASSLLVTHRLQDAFTMATHQFDPKTNQLRALPRGQYCDVPMSFLILRDGKVIFDGDVRQLAHTKDEWIPVDEVEKAAEVYFRFCAGA